MVIRIGLIGLLLCSSAVFAQTPDPCATAPQTCATLIETHATSEMRIPNSVVDVVVGVSASGKDLPEVQRVLADHSNRLLAYLKAQQVDRLMTTFVNFSPDTRSQKSGPDKTVGYDGSARVSFRAKPDKIAELLGGVLANGADAIESTGFTPTEEEVVVARRKLSEQATKTAIAQANAIAEAAGLKVAAIRNVDVDNSMDMSSLHTFKNKQVYLDGFTGGLPARNALAPIQAAAGENELSVSVSVTAAATR